MLIAIHPTTYRSGGFLAHGVLNTDGTTTKYASRSTTDYISVKSNTAYSGFAPYLRACYYDAKKVLISYNDDKNSTRTTPENTAFLKFNFLNEKEQSVMFCEGSVIKPYEPYTDRVPSPSPEYPQPIEVTDKTVTVTIKGGIEQQSITLVPPKPLTKWDKLEKVDGAWKWVYQSERLIFENSDGWAFYPRSCNKAKIQLKKKSEINYENKFLKKDLLCSHFVENVNAYYDSGNTCSFIISSIETNSLYFKFGQESNVSNMETFEKWIVENKPVVIYKTATPEYIPLPKSEQDKLNALATYYPTSEIINNGGCNMEISYVADIKNYIDNKFRQLSKATCNLQAQNYALIEGLTSAMSQEDNP